jgi:NADH-ubiquinone oxidoreductase chain 4
MPNLPTISFSSTLANMSSPGTSSFIGEFPISVGAFQRNSLVATLAALGMILGAAYSLWLYNRVVSGNFKLVRYENQKHLAAFWRILYL